MRDRKQGADGADGSASSWSGGAPGKVTRTSRLAPVQRKPAAAATAAPAPDVVLGDDDRDFARKFATEFAFVLGGLPAEVKAGGDPAATWLVQSLTAWQRARLTEFMATAVIPEGLFIAKESDGCKLTSAHKILLASHILEKGTTPSSTWKDQRVHAQSCGHWVEYVWIYAGVQSGIKDPNAGAGTTWGVNGPIGQQSFGGGGANQGPGLEGTSAAVSDKAGGRTCDSGTQRKAPLGYPSTDEMWKHLDSIESGDWLYLDNGNPAMHSIVFVSWLRKPTKDNDGPGQSSGTARGLSQLDGAAGGKEQPGPGHPTPWTIGYPNRSGVDPVTAITRPAKDAGPPRDEASLLHYDRGIAIEKTMAHIATYGLDVGKLHAALAASVDDGLAGLAALEPTQKALCQSIRDKAAAEASIWNVVTLVALAQRVHPVYVSGGDGRAIDGVFNPGGQDASLIKGGIAALKRGAVPAAQRTKLDFVVDFAVEKNRLLLEKHHVVPSLLARPMADAVRAKLAGGKGKARYDGVQADFDLRMQEHGSSETLLGFTHMVALYQFLDGNNAPDGWKPEYASIVGAEAWAQAKVEID